MRNGERKYVSMKKVIMHATTTKATATGNYECTSEHFGDSLQLTNWILDSGATCHMTPEVSDFTPGSL